MDREAFLERSRRDHDFENGEPTVADAGACASTSGSERCEMVRMAPVVIGALLGKGFFGKVYKGTANGKVIAVKEIDLGFNTDINVNDVDKEIEILDQLSHPNIVQFLGSMLVKHETKLHIYMEICEGGDLGKKIRNQEPVHFEEWEITPWMRDIATGIEYLHSKEFIHRDIKPTNILLSGNTAKIADFGCGKFFQELQSYYTNNGGDRNYMPPEYFMKGKFGRSGDMWSVGCTFYELTVLKRAFKETNEILQRRKRQFSLSLIPSKYSKDLRILIRTLLQSKPEKRPTASGVIEWLRIDRYQSNDGDESLTTDSNESLNIDCNDSPFFFFKCDVSNSGQ